MSGRIQASPSGFLSLLGLIGSGENPTEALPEVRAVVDIGDLYAGRNLTQVQDVLVGAVNAGDLIEITVPAGEAWYMLGIASVMDTWSAAGAQPALNLHVNPAGTVQQNPVDTTFFPAVTATTDRLRKGFWFPTRFVALGGTVFGAQYAVTTVQTCNLRIRAIFHRLTR